MVVGTQEGRGAEPAAKTAATRWQHSTGQTEPGLQRQPTATGKKVRLHIPICRKMEPSRSDQILPYIRAVQDSWNVRSELSSSFAMKLNATHTHTHKVLIWTSEREEKQNKSVRAFSKTHCSSRQSLAVLEEFTVPKFTWNWNSSGKADATQTVPRSCHFGLVLFETR